MTACRLGGGCLLTAFVLAGVTAADLGRARIPVAIALMIVILGVAIFSYVEGVAFGREAWGPKE